jgi:hypothetical protein
MNTLGLRAPAGEAITLYGPMTANIDSVLSTSASGNALAAEVNSLYSIDVGDVLSVDIQHLVTVEVCE